MKCIIKEIKEENYFMKRQVRRGVFETNSSSTHSITMCMKSDYDKWSNGEGYFYTGSGFGYPDDKKPKNGCFYAREEVIEFLKVYKYRSNDVNWDDEEYVNELLRENDFIDGNYENDYLEWYEEEFTTPNGETVVAFGEYGYDG